MIFIFFYLIYFFFVTNAQFYRTGTCLPSFCQNVTSTLAQYLYTVPYKKEYVIITNYCREII